MDPLLIRFKNEVCLNSKDVDSEEELCWRSLSIGWFLANGADVDTAYRLAATARYTHEYWQEEVV